MWFDKRFQSLKTEVKPLQSKDAASESFKNYKNIEQKDIQQLNDTYNHIFTRSLSQILPGTMFAWFVLRKGRIPRIFRNPLLEEKTHREEVLSKMQTFFAKSVIFFGSCFTFGYYYIKYDTVKMFLSYKYKHMVEDYIKSKDRSFLDKFLENKKRGLDVGSK